MGCGVAPTESARVVAEDFMRLAQQPQHLRGRHAISRVEEGLDRRLRNLCLRRHLARFTESGDCDSERGNGYQKRDERP